MTVCSIYIYVFLYCSSESCFSQMETILNIENKNKIVIRRQNLLKQALEQLGDMEEKDFQNRIIDEGGPTRELFTEIFTQTGLIDEVGTFKRDQMKLDNREYYMLGKIVAYAILHGHPGPRFLSKTTLDYILELKEPSPDDVYKEDDIKDTAALAALTDVCL